MPDVKVKPNTKPSEPEVKPDVKPRVNPPTAPDWVTPDDLCDDQKRRITGV